MRVKYFNALTSVASLEYSIISIFTFQYGKNINNISLNSFSEGDYILDRVSNKYTSETQFSNSKLTLVINPEEDLKSKEYKVIYLFFNNLLTNEQDVLGGVIDISSDSVSNVKNFINLPNSFSCQLEFQCSDYVSHLQTKSIKGDTFKAPKKSTSFLNFLSYEKIIRDRQSNNTPYLSDTTLTNYGLKIT